jgi:hypothetical protein
MYMVSDIQGRCMYVWTGELERCLWLQMTEITTCETRRPRELYIVLDGQERCLWLRMTEIGICGTRQPREVYVISGGRERCLDPCLVRLASSVQTFGWVNWLMSQFLTLGSRV